MAFIWHCFANALSQILVPPRCAACDIPLYCCAVFCPCCANSVMPATPSSIENIWSYGLYGGALATAIQKFKYRNHSELAHPLGHLLRDVIRKHSLQADLIVPIPLHPMRLVERGYNQSTLLGRHVANEIGARYGPRIIRRLSNNPQQAMLFPSERSGNTTAFHVTEAHQVQHQIVLVVDDVVTSGNTLRSCFQALIHAGAREVKGLTIARSMAMNLE